MELEYLKKISDRYTSTSIGDLTKIVSEMDMENPVVIAGCALILLSISAFTLYLLLSVLSAFSYKNRAKVIEDTSVYQLNSRISSLEMTVAEYKNTIKHLSQKAAADRLSIKAEIGAIKSDSKQSVLDDLRIEQYRNVA